MAPAMPSDDRRCGAVLAGESDSEPSPAEGTEPSFARRVTSGMHVWSFALLFVAGASPAWFVGSLRLQPVLLLVVALTLGLALARHLVRAETRWWWAGMLGVTAIASPFVVDAALAESARGAALTSAAGWSVSLLAGVAVFGLPSPLLPALLRRLSVLVAVWGGAVAMAATLQAFGVLPGADAAIRSVGPFTFQRATILFGQPNPLAVFLSSSLLLTFLPRPEGRIARWLVVVGRAALVSGVVVTHSRAAFVGLILGVGLAWFVTHRSRWVRTMGRVTAGVGLFVAFVASLTPAIVESMRDALTRLGVTDFSALERLELMRVAQRMWLDRPLLGHGPGAYERVASEYGYEPASALGMPHNVVLHAASEVGILGVLVLAAFLVAMLALPPHLPGAVLAAFWSGTVALAFGWPLTHGLGEPYLALAALAWILARRGPREGTPHGRIPARNASP